MYYIENYEGRLCDSNLDLCKNSSQASKICYALLGCMNLNFMWFSLNSFKIVNLLATNLSSVSPMHVNLPAV